MDSSTTLSHVVLVMESGIAHVRWLLNWLLVVLGTRVKLLYLRLFYLLIEWIIQRVKIFRIIVHVLKLSRDALLLRSLGHIILILQVHIHVLVLWLGWRPLTILLLLQEVVVLESAIHLGVRRAHPLLALRIRTRVRSHIFGFARKLLLFITALDCSITRACPRSARADQTASLFARVCYLGYL